MTDEPMDINKQEGLQLRRLSCGGFLVCHPDIYNLGSLFHASTTIDEAFEFMRKILDPVPLENIETTG